MTIEKNREILLNGESVNLECKRAKSKVSKLVNSLIVAEL